MVDDQRLYIQQKKRKYGKQRGITRPAGLDPTHQRMIQFGIVFSGRNCFRVQKERHLDQEAEYQEQKNITRGFLSEKENHPAMLLIKFHFCKANAVAVIARDDQLAAANLFSVLRHELVTAVEILQRRVVRYLAAR